MKTEEARYRIRRSLQKVRLIKITEIMLIALGVGMILMAIARFFLPELISVVIGAVGGVAAIVWKVNQTGVWQWGESDLAYFLNGRFPQLQESADLMLSTGPLTSLQEIQLNKVLVEYERLVLIGIRIPNQIMRTMVVLVAGFMCLLLFPKSSVVPSKPRSEVVVVPDSIATLSIPALSEISLLVVPPSYTKVGSYSTKNPQAKIQENSMVEWRASFKGNPVRPRVVFAGADSFKLETNKAGYFFLRRKIVDQSFYQIAWNDEEGHVYSSDFYSVEVIRDAHPKVEVVGLEQFNEVTLEDSSNVLVQAKLTDDYGLKDGYIIATVAKGSGESVKFREEKLRFAAPQVIAGKSLTVRRELDIHQLGLEPGDELYFYIEVLDNKVPLPNTSRTETFFIALKDTATVVAIEDTGLGVDLMPEYFRSQRQIIIDTEKLIKEQKRISKTEFNSRSNELGFDQKTLRLKYGQFLGEEDAGGIGIVAGPPVELTEEEEAEEKEDPMKKFGHQHDTENEHNQVIDKQQAKKDDHGHVEEATEEGEQEDPMKAIMHVHDTEESATFFIQSIKTKLKAALTLMWDAELHLRMYEPKKSLPYQYRILKLLKEISQDSRIYVHRTGFDPPPIKEEKRLSGDLEEVVNSIERMGKPDSIVFPAIRAAIAKTEYLLQQKEITLDEESRSLFRKAGYEVALVAVKEPGKYLRSLSTLKLLSDNSLKGPALTTALLNVRSDFWKILPAGTLSPVRQDWTVHKLDRRFLKNLKSLRE